MWIIILETWAVSEEKNQFNPDPEYKHELSKELDIFKSFRELYMQKLNYMISMEEKRKEIVEFNQNFIDISKVPELFATLRAKALGDYTPHN